MDWNLGFGFEDLLKIKPSASAINSSPGMAVQAKVCRLCVDLSILTMRGLETARDWLDFHFFGGRKAYHLNS